MREYIAEKLNSMNDSGQKEELRRVLEQVFLPLYDETMEKYTALEQRVKDELPSATNGYGVYSTMLPKEKAISYTPWLFPVCPLQKGHDLNVSGGKLLKGFVLDTVFLEADYLISKEISGSVEQFSGVIQIAGEEVKVRVSLKRNTDYVEAVSVLYSHFVNNGVPWTTLNAPYFHKLFDIILTEDIVLPNNNDEKLSLTWNISFGKYDKYVRKNMVPVWNIQKVFPKSDGFPIPVVDKKVYEYRFELAEQDTVNGYLVDYNNIPIISTRREEDAYIVTTSEKTKDDWIMYEIIKPTMTETVNLPYPILSNIQEDQFASRMISYYGSKINTKAELARVINSFDIHKYIKYENCRVLNNQTITGETYESNAFLTDEIRDGNISKTLLLQFSKNSSRETYLMRDVMSFVVSQIQLIYPEYNCVGALI